MRLPLLAATILLSTLGACAPVSMEERQAWLDEFEQLVDHMGAAYANLDWVMRERGVDPYALSEDARERLRGARTRRGARGSIERFVKAFDDPHFYVRKGDETVRHGGSASGFSLALGADDALDAMSFDGRDLDFDIAFDDLPGWRRIEPSAENPFAWGVFDAGQAQVGVVRIGHFGVDVYPEVARPLWDDFARGREGDCDVRCRWEFFEVVMDALLGHLVDGARSLRAAGVDAIAIDITKNGGGTDWAAVAPRIFAPPLRRCPPLGLVRHPHHADRLTRRREHVESLLASLNLDAGARSILEAGRDSLRAREARAHAPCDRGAAFREPGARPPCDQLVFGPGCGVLEYVEPGLLDEVEDRALVFAPLDQNYEEGVWTGPLFVLMDGGTASASEHFVALLEANDAAVLMGERTLGAGCGFIGGGIPLYLEHLDVTVWMPDCARYRAGGRNEMDGIEPDLPLDWGGGGGARARAVHAALRERLGG